MTDCEPSEHVPRATCSPTTALLPPGRGYALCQAPMCGPVTSGVALWALLLPALSPSLLTFGPSGGAWT